MATDVIKHALRYRCDAPACTVNIVVAAADPPPGGYHGLVQRVSDFGVTDKVPWYACNQNHIETAVLYVLDTWEG